MKKIIQRKKNPNPLSPIPIPGLFFLSLPAFPKEGDTAGNSQKDETEKTSSSACSPARNLVIFPINVPLLWGFGAQISCCAPGEQSQRSRLGLGAFPHLPHPCWLHLHGRPGNCKSRRWHLVNLPGEPGPAHRVPRAALQSDACLTGSCCCFMGSQHMFPLKTGNGGLGKAPQLRERPRPHSPSGRWLFMAFPLHLEGGSSWLFPATLDVPWMWFSALVGSVEAVAGRSTAQSCFSWRAVTPGYGDVELGTEGRIGLLWDFFCFVL